MNILFCIKQVLPILYEGGRKWNNQYLQKIKTLFPPILCACDKMIHTRNFGMRFVSVFGYVRPQADELRVKEYAWYRAVYCGLCRSMEKNISPLLSLTLRYDYVLLAMTRMLLCDEHSNVEMHRCMANPLHKKPMLADSETLSFCAACAAMLAHASVLDNIRDEHGAVRLLYRAAQIPTAAMYKKAIRRSEKSGTDTANGVAAENADAAQYPKTLQELGETVKKHLAALSELERSALDSSKPRLSESENSAPENSVSELSEPEKTRIVSPDEAAQPFGDVLSAIFSYGLDDESSRRIARHVGTHVGRFIYLCDAADDAPKDEKSGAYNPFVQAAKEMDMPVRDYLNAYRVRIETALHMECAAALDAISLSKSFETHPARPCIENILILGMPAAAKHVLDMPGVPLSKKDAAK